MTITAIRQPRRFPPYVETWSELDQWLLGRITHARSYLDEDEIAQSLGTTLLQKHQVRLEVYTEIRDKIAPAVAAEADERTETAAADRIDLAYKGLDSINDALEIRRLNGDR